MLKHLFFVDKKYSEIIYRLSVKSTNLSTLINKFTPFGGSIPMFLIILVVSNAKLLTAIILFLMISISYVASEKLIKGIFKRKRPSYSILKTYSFPSTHALCTVSLLIFYLICIPNTSLALTALVLMYSAFVPFSRIYLGFHYISDILGGLAIGSILGILISVIYLVVR